MFRQNCFRLSKDIESLADVSGFDIKGPFTWSSSKLLWESGGGDDISKGGAYTVEEAVEFVGVRAI